VDVATLISSRHNRECKKRIFEKPDDTFVERIW